MFGWFQHEINSKKMVDDDEDHTYEVNSIEANPIRDRAFSGDLAEPSIAKGSPATPWKVGATLSARGGRGRNTECKCDVAQPRTSPASSCLSVCSSAGDRHGGEASVARHAAPAVQAKQTLYLVFLAMFVDTMGSQGLQVVMRRTQIGGSAGKEGSLRGAADIR